MISVDSEMRTIELEVSEQELAERRKEWKAPPLKQTSGFLYKYARDVQSAHLGAFTD